MKGSAKSLLSVLFPNEHTKGVSVLQMTPSLFNRWSDSELKDIVFGPKTSLRALILGGEPFPPLSKFKHCQGLVLLLLHMEDLYVKASFNLELIH